MNNEQYICYNFLKQHPLFSLKSQETMEKFFANNFLILNSSSYSFQRLKPFPYSVTQYARWTSHYDWVCLYRTHCLHKKAINYYDLVRPTIFALGRFKNFLRNSFKQTQPENA